MGFGQGLSGLNAASQNLDVIGNNIANSSTVGFKASTIAFADVYANSRVGLGVQVAAVNQRFTTGNLSTTGNQFDMAIDGEKGLFRLVDQSGTVVYSRNGQFSPNKDFYLMNAQGHTLTGYMANDDGTISAELGKIRVPVGNIAPQATTEATVRANFDSREKILPFDDSFTEVAGTDPKEYTPTIDYTNPDNYTHSLPMTVYDSLGNPHQLTQYFIKVAGQPGEVSEWKVVYRFGEQFLHGNLPADIGSDAKDNSTLISHTIYFDPDGRLIDPQADEDPITGKKPAPAPFDLSITGLGGAASPASNLVMKLSYNGSTQFGGDFSPKFTQNGYTTGDYSSMSIAENGEIVANYTNGESKVMGQLVLADFNNLNGLRPVGGNTWVETGVSGQPVLGTPGTNGLATLKGQAVEESNVDMSQELVNMIIAQRTYQANAQTIKTQDQILQTLITLR